MPPNIIVIIIDALRASALSSYGNTEIETPHIDQFASRSILYRNAFTTSTWTIPTHTSMLTGLFQSEHRIENIKADRALNKQIHTFPEILAKEGYLTSAFSQNLLFSPKFNFNYFGEFFTSDDLLEARGLTRKLQEMAVSNHGLRTSAAKYIKKLISLRLVFDQMLDWVGRNSSDSPFLMMSNIANVHYPWALPVDILVKNRTLPRKREYLGLDPFRFNSEAKEVTQDHREIWKELYLGATQHVDREVGRFITRLQDQGVLENSVVVLTSDHGEMLGDYRDIVGHTLSLHDNVIRIPLILHHPDLQSGRVVEPVVQNIDLFPSILDWGEAPSGSALPAQMKRPSLPLSNDALNGNGFAIAEEDYTESYDVRGALMRINPALDPHRYPVKQTAIHIGSHKFIKCAGTTDEFYDLINDPYEQTNLIDSEEQEDKQMLADLQARLSDWEDHLDRYPPVPLNQESPETDPQVLARLRDLGYTE